METYSAFLAICAGNLPVTGEFPSQRRVSRSFDVFFHLRLNKRLSKQLWGWWFETPSRPLWRHCNVSWVATGMYVKNPTYILQNMDTFSKAILKFMSKMALCQHHRNRTKREQRANPEDTVLEWRLKSPASRLLAWPFIYAQIKKNTKSFASLAFVRGIHPLPVNSPHKWPVTRKMFPFDDVIMEFLHTKVHENAIQPNYLLVKWLLISASV